MRPPAKKAARVAYCAPIRAACAKTQTDGQMAHTAHSFGHHALSARRNPARFLRALALLLGLLLLAGTPIAYILWPRWPEPVAPNAPALPITVAGELFNVPPAAIRVAMQRRAGAHERIDLVFLWPSLSPPDLSDKPSVAEAPPLADRLFVAIAASAGALPEEERRKTIYPRYVAGGPTDGPDGLRVHPFRDGTPYQGEDLYEAAAPARFVARCTRQMRAVPGMCLHERRVGDAHITVRFPREWLSDWRAVASGIDLLIANLRSSSR